MKVFDGCACRLGNALFRYFASSLFCIVYKGQRTYNEEECNYIVTEEFYRDWCNKILYSNELLNIDTNLGYKFNTFYQTDIYKLFRNELIDWCNQHQNDTVQHHEPSCLYRIGDLLSELDDSKKYDFVVHIRLEDFVTCGEKLIIHPKSICEVLDKIDTEKVCFVSNNITTLFEQKYMDYFKNKYQHKFQIVFESNDIVTDFKIMRNAKTMVCSLSTLCWCAGFLSKNIEKVYFPKNRYHGWYNQTFSTVIQNTETYDNILCNEQELNLFFENN